MRVTVLVPDGHRWRQWLAAVAFVPIAVALFVAPDTLPALSGLAIAWIWTIFFLRLKPRPRDASLVVERGAVRLREGWGRSTRIRARDLVAAASAPASSPEDPGAILALTLHARQDAPLVLRFETEADAAAARRALGVGARGFGEIAWSTWRDAGAGALVVRAAIILGSFAGAVALVLHQVEAAAWIGAALGPLIAMALISRALGPASRPFAMGPDAVSQGATRVPHRAIAGVRIEGDALSVTTAEGEVPLRAPGRSAMERELAATLVRAAAARASASARSSRDSDKTPRDATSGATSDATLGTAASGALDAMSEVSAGPLERRPQEDRRAWLQRLDALAVSLREPAGYRRASLDLNALCDALGDPDTAPMMRAAAARVLARVAPDEAGPRIADALAADPGGMLRVRVDGALEEDVADAARVLDRLEP